MKKLIMILLLIAGFSVASYAQVFKNREKKEVDEKRKKVKPHKQMYHFEKQDKDKNIAHNGSNYKKSHKYKVDGDGFAAYQESRKPFFIPDKSRRVQRQSRRMAYAVK